MISAEGQVQKFLFRVRTPTHSKRCRIVWGSLAPVNPSPCALLRKSLQDFFDFSAPTFSALAGCSAEKCVGSREARIEVLSVNPEQGTEGLDGENESGAGAEAWSGIRNR
jgi:hypothetical protein